MCVPVCPVVPDYYGEDLNDGNKKCVGTCTLSYQYADPLTRTCVTHCNSAEGYFGNATSQRCYLKCPSGYGDPTSTNCVSVCP